MSHHLPAHFSVAASRRAVQKRLTELADSCDSQSRGGGIEEDKGCKLLVFVSRVVENCRDLDHKRGEAKLHKSRLPKP